MEPSPKTNDRDWMEDHPVMSLVLIGILFAVHQLFEHVLFNPKVVLAALAASALGVWFFRIPEMFFFAVIGWMCVCFVGLLLWRWLGKKDDADKDY